ncbi:MAG: hypothetical protein ABIP45_06705 [Knoellia sp.]
MRVVARFLGVLAGATLATAGLVGASAPAQAASCSGTNGVTVVIQSSNGTSTHCASGDPSSAMNALASVASVTQVQTQPGFICQIDGYPNTNCSRTPPASAYWAFFHGGAGGSWTYSQSGAASYDPAPGSSIGFRFGSGAAPSVSPASPAPAPTRTTSTPKTTTIAPKPSTAKPRPTAAAPRSTTVAPQRTTGAARPTTPAPPGGTTSGRGGTVASTSASAGASASAKTSASSPSASSSTSAGATVGASPSTSVVPSASGADDAASAHKVPQTDSGGSGRLIGGGLLLLVLAVAVAAVAVRRRNAGGTSAP